ncbi:MAG: class I SAM-dependent methyltransferase [Myxococcaceae bacterium]
MAANCNITPNTKVLVLGIGDGQAVLFLTREVGAQVVAADVSAEALERLRSKLQPAEVAQRVRLQRVDYDALPFAKGEFAAVFVDVMPVMPLQTTVSTLRPLLAPNGRLCLGYPVRVSRHPSPGAVRFWEQKLGETLLLPREVLQILERSGYEPQIIETLEDAGLDAFYRAVDQACPAEAPGAGMLREEIDLYRSQQGRASTSFAVMVGRRREPGERPPPARNE